MAAGGRRMSGLGFGVLLFAMAIQGLTPDYASLASPWLLRLVSAWSMGEAIAEGDPSSRPAPLRGDDAGDLDGSWGTVAAKAGARVRLDDDGPSLRSLLSAGFLERPAPPACPSHRPPRPAVRGPGGLISALCRFRC